MQNAGFAALGLDWAYVPLPTPPELLADAVRGLVGAGFAGANVTIPHKEAVIALCDELDDVAARAGSVNTLVIRRRPCPRLVHRRARRDLADRARGAARARARHRRGGEGGRGRARGRGRRGRRARPARPGVATVCRGLRRARQRDPGQRRARRHAARRDAGRRPRLPPRRAADGAHRRRARSSTAIPASTGSTSCSPRAPRRSSAGRGRRRRSS